MKRFEGQLDLFGLDIMTLQRVKKEIRDHCEIIKTNRAFSSNDLPEAKGYFWAHDHLIGVIERLITEAAVYEGR